MSTTSESPPALIEAIHLADAAVGPPRAVPQATAVPGRGLVGDRYERGLGTFSDWPKDHELTLVEAEVIEALAREHDVNFAPGETRRNDMVFVHGELWKARPRGGETLRPGQPVRVSGIGPELVLEVEPLPAE